MRIVFCFVILMFCVPFSMADKGGSGNIEKPGKSEEQRVMNNARLAELIKRVDENAQGRPGFWEFTVEAYRVTVMTDEKADRMRIIIPIVEAEKLDKALLVRTMQANFDSALDARYAIARGVLWAAFIHPLSSLSDKDFLSGIGQTVNITASFGDTFSSGGVIFHGGDSADIQRRQLIDRLLDKGLAI